MRTRREMIRLCFSTCNLVKMLISIFKLVLLSCRDEVRALWLKVYIDNLLKHCKNIIRLFINISSKSRTPVVGDNKWLVHQALIFTCRNVADNVFEGGPSNGKTTWTITVIINLNSLGDNSGFSAGSGRCPNHPFQ